MTLQQILDEIRDTLDDKVAPYLWSDSEITRYANRAEERLAEEAYLIADSTTAAVCTMSLLSGTASYAKHSSIVLVNDPIYLPTKNRSVYRRTLAWLESKYPPWRSMGPGTPILFCEELDSGKIHFIPTPDSSMTANLSVVRRPLVSLTTSSLTSSPEIPAGFHKYLKNGILALAYQKQDTECYDPAKAQKYMDMFEMDIKQAFRKNDHAHYSSHTVGIHRGFI